jgi:tectonin beta-propeller repeat-containing protein 1
MGLHGEWDTITICGATQKVIKIEISNCYLFFKKKFHLGYGGFLKGLEISNSGINNMTDTYHYYIYENQRWNPISGFSTASLPTDRHLWSDVTGKHKRSKEFNKLLSMHWQFVSDWLVDFHVPGGCDRDGWQYAVGEYFYLNQIIILKIKILIILDFPMTYHAKKQFSDLVRRRRWYRKCRLNTKGPFQELGQSKVVDISLQSFKNSELVCAWAISSAGDALFRRNVTTASPCGSNWEHIPCDVKLCSISCSHDNKVWCVSKNGSMFFRTRVTFDNPIGEAWKRIDSPSNMQFKLVSAGEKGVWALDTQSRLMVRRDISSSNPEGKTINFHV